MIDVENDERTLDRFRTWLQETRQEAAAADEGTNGAAPPSSRFGLDRLIEEFTALRHEIKLQTRSSRALEERVEASLTSLADAASAFRSAASTATATADKNYATTLAELDEALERGNEQWKKNVARLTLPSSPTAVDVLNEIYAGQSWWQRRRTAAYHRRVNDQLERAVEKAQGERLATLTALMSGYALIQQRVARAMANAGIVRIATIGQLVDPERMIVVEVVDADGPAGHVIEEIRRGYTWQSGLLRAAEVRAIRPRFEKEQQGS